jgi:amidase
LRTASARVTTIPRGRQAFAFDPKAEPALTAEPGAVVAFETTDEGYERLWRGESAREVGHGRFNAVTGPLFVRGALPGDALRVEILEIRMDRCWAVWYANYGAFKTKRLQIRPLRIRRGRVPISKSLSVPYEPMIGCIGLAPAKGKSSTYVPTFPWGGNMDLPEARPGATVFLPVQVPGALLSVGDLHAAMGAAEPACVGLEGRGTAVVRVGIEKGMRLPFPRIRLGKETICIGMGRTQREASRAALSQAWEILVRDRKLAPLDAFAFASARVGLRLGGPAHEIMLAIVPDP